LTEEKEKEVQTVNIKDINTKLNQVMEFLKNKEPESDGKGIVENKTEEIKPFVDVYADWLRSDKKTLREAIAVGTMGSVIPEIWATEIELLSPEGAEGYFLGDIVQWKDTVKGKPGDTVHVPTVSAVDSASISSGTEPTFVNATVSSIPVTLTQRGHGFYITKADMDDVIDGSLDALIKQSKLALMRYVDQYLLASIQASNNNAGAGTVTETGAMAATVLAKAWGSVTAGSYTPAAVVMHPVPFAKLLQDSSFTNAATYGDDTVIKEARIPRYLGMDVVPLVQGTLDATGGTYKSYMMAKGAIVGARKREMDVEKEYYVKDQRHYVVSAIRFGGTVVHTSGIAKIQTVDT